MGEGMLTVDQANGEIFPWEDVRASQRDPRAQAENDVPGARNLYGPMARPCPKCGTPPDRLTWIVFSSPWWTWRSLCGREGYLTICEPCRFQVDFFMTVLS